LFHDLTERLPALEEMDREDIDRGALEGALRSLIRINGVGNGAGLFWPSLRALLEARKPGRGPLRVLDIGCGAGDLSLRLERRARKHGFSLQVDGCDRSPVAVDMARRINEKAGTLGAFFVLDAVAGSIPGGYDVIMASLFLHHLDNGQAPAILAKMAGSAGTMLLVSDLVRSRCGLFLVHLATRTLSRSPVVHADGVTSLRAAFTVGEIETMCRDLGLAGATVTRRWPERFVMTWKRA